jgi:hypothetical protein
MLVVSAAVVIGHATKLSGISGPAKNPDWEVAPALPGLGIHSGERVCYLGYALTDEGWAHLARVHIAAEIPVEDVPGFWSAGRPQQIAVANWLAAKGVKAIITRDAPASALAAGWERISETDYYVLTLVRSPG